MSTHEYDSVCVSWNIDYGVPLHIWLIEHLIPRTKPFDLVTRAGVFDIASDDARNSDMWYDYQMKPSTILNTDFCSRKPDKTTQWIAKYCSASLMCECSTI